MLSPGEDQAARVPGHLLEDAVNLLGQVPGAPSLTLAVARRDDVVLIAVGDSILADVLGLLEDGNSKKALGDDKRFRAAFARLPAA